MMFSASFSVSNLGGVDPNHHQLFGIPLLQLFELRQDVHAIDAAVGPEIEEDELPFQVRLGKGLFGIEPLHSLGKLGELDAVAKGIARRRGGLFGGCSLALVAVPWSPAVAEEQRTAPHARIKNNAADLCRAHVMTAFSG